MSKVTPKIKLLEKDIHDIFYHSRLLYKITYTNITPKHTHSFVVQFKKIILDLKEKIENAIKLHHTVSDLQNIEHHEANTLCKRFGIPFDWMLYLVLKVYYPKPLERPFAFCVNISETSPLNVIKLYFNHYTINNNVKNEIKKIKMGLNKLCFRPFNANLQRSIFIELLSIHFLRFKATFDLKNFNEDNLNQYLNIFKQLDHLRKQIFRTDSQHELSIKKLNWHDLFCIFSDHTMYKNKDFTYQPAISCYLKMKNTYTNEKKFFVPLVHHFALEGNPLPDKYKKELGKWQNNKGCKIIIPDILYSELTIVLWALIEKPNEPYLQTYFENMLINLVVACKLCGLSIHYLNKLTYLFLKALKLNKQDLQYPLTIESKTFFSLVQYLNECKKKSKKNYYPTFIWNIAIEEMFNYIYKDKLHTRLKKHLDDLSRNPVIDKFVKMIDNQIITQSLEQYLNNLDAYQSKLYKPLTWLVQDLSKHNDEIYMSSSRFSDLKVLAKHIYDKKDVTPNKRNFLYALIRLFENRLVRSEANGQILRIELDLKCFLKKICFKGSLTSEESDCLLTLLENIYKSYQNNLEDCYRFLTNTLYIAVRDNHLNKNAIKIIQSLKTDNQIIKKLIANLHNNIEELLKFHNFSDLHAISHRAEQAIITFIKTPNSKSKLAKQNAKEMVLSTAQIFEFYSRNINMKLSLEYVDGGKDVTKLEVGGDDIQPILWKQVCQFIHKVNQICQTQKLKIHKHHCTTVKKFYPKASNGPAWQAKYTLEEFFEVPNNISNIMRNISKFAAKASQKNDKENIFELFLSILRYEYALSTESVSAIRKNNLATMTDIQNQRKEKAEKTGIPLSPLTFTPLRQEQTNMKAQIKADWQTLLKPFMSQLVKISWNTYQNYIDAFYQNHQRACSRMQINSPEKLKQLFDEIFESIYLEQTTTKILFPSTTSTTEITTNTNGSCCVY